MPMPNIFDSKPGVAYYFMLHENQIHILDFRLTFFTRFKYNATDLTQSYFILFFQLLIYRWNEHKSALHKEHTVDYKECKPYSAQIVCSKSFQYMFTWDVFIKFNLPFLDS